MRGVLLRDVLAGIQIDHENPRVLSEYFFVCIAADDYRVVYSWNEIFNTSVGDQVYIVLEKDGVPAEKMEDRMLMISPKDFKTGRRYLKNLSAIEINRSR
jgi:hypothetical protein